MKHLLSASLFFLAFNLQAQNLPDTEDANLVPSDYEKRTDERVNLPDSRDDDFIPSSQEPRQREEVRGDRYDAREESFGPDSTDPYLDDDNYGRSQ